MSFSSQTAGIRDNGLGLVAQLGRVHLVGCGGVGMASLAEALSLRGLRVSGSEIEDRPELARLRAAGCTIYTSHRESNLHSVDTVVYSTAVPPDNVELRAAAKRGIRVLHRSVALATLLQARFSVAVAGTHGKTSTAAMLVSALSAAGAVPEYVIGGRLANQSGAGAGETSTIVVEADESDGSFLTYQPDAVVITNIDTDHLDLYHDIDALTRAFSRFAEQVGESGFVVMPEDDRYCRRVARDLRAKGIRVRTFGDGPAADLPVRVDAELPGSVRFTARLSDQDEEVLTVPVPGRHMAFNAAAALLTALELGASPVGAGLGIAQYPGVARRFEFKGAPRGIRVYDDYACHHTSIRASLTALRHTAEGGRLIAVVEPCRQYRMDQFQTEIADALSVADRVVVLPVFDSDDSFDHAAPSEALTSLVNLPDHDKFLARTPDAAARAVDAFARPGDLVVTLGAPGVARVAEQIVQTLEHTR
ncbi:MULTISPECIES: UDP-N-acetylmuramate--L-alanine ligase [Amycolatopsis]|uniref:UDP-N-acetylmuramate--L-alanine ligase n=1 Tax=Amycolatopsis echigonensis TaxID=2576905 RepID=A0A2N3WNI1_9PSEU|nr:MULTISPECIES: UDP-N-acetylmuramate--L-alanine ligase [Amycolatopsis]MBB2498384.1 UDP-N-acetylmuramate--L-alanine ligase [Amycolatopsis echigonensis]PKV95428.1 UDP-N-acetylmuramate--L-alanine ligase [Amycolatopsis niigatensis]